MTGLVADNDEVLAELPRSTPRMWIGVAMLACLGALLVSIAAQAPEMSLISRGLFFLIAACALFLAWSMVRTGVVSVRLTRDRLTASNGRVLCDVDQIVSVDRGFVIYKPSNGFVLKLNTEPGRAWEPGLWWRVGSRIGLGGTTSGTAAKNMAEIIAMLLRERDGTGG